MCPCRAAQGRKEPPLDQTKVPEGVLQHCGDGPISHDSLTPSNIRVQLTSLPRLLTYPLPEYTMASPVVLPAARGVQAS